MEVENMMITAKKLITTTNCKNSGDDQKEEEGEEDDDAPLPGFRFHPTDEELVGFYLRRKVEKKPISIELIKQADIYKYDPWDLPKSTNVGEKDKEWYFFCKRGRKYKNSVRPNRVTGSGFWKATGIDRPIYSGRECIGLKKSLVYYRGSAGKGTKTEWMMHEFRLPAKHMVGAIAVNAQEAEVWTLCRILKRNVPYRKCVPDWRIAINKKNNIIIKSNIIVEASSETCSIESSDRNGPSSYISFSAPTTTNKQNNNNNYNVAANHHQGPPGHNNIVAGNEINYSGHFSLVPQATSSSAPAGSWFSNHNSSSVYGDFNELLRHADWEDLRSVVDCAAPSSATNYPMYL